MKTSAFGAGPNIEIFWAILEGVRKFVYNRRILRSRIVHDLAQAVLRIFGNSSERFWKPAAKMGSISDIDRIATACPHDQPVKFQARWDRDFMLLLRSLFFTFLLPGTVTVFIPYWIVSSGDIRVSNNHSFRYLGLPVILIGAAGLLGCIWQFFSEGHGTLAPIDAPKQLVVRGLYKYVRNPMYVSVVTILIGEAILFRSLPILIEAGVFFGLTYLFVVFYEEPKLRRQFGESYQRYSQEVGRWVPRSKKSVHE